MLENKHDYKLSHSHIGYCSKHIGQFLFYLHFFMCPFFLLVFHFCVLHSTSFAFPISVWQKALDLIPHHNIAAINTCIAHMYMCMKTQSDTIRLYTYKNRAYIWQTQKAGRTCTSKKVICKSITTRIMRPKLTIMIA